MKTKIRLTIQNMNWTMRVGIACTLMQSGCTTWKEADEPARQSRQHIVNLLTGRPLTGFEPIHKAAMGGELYKVKELVEKGEKPNRRTADGQSPIDIAAQKDYADIVRFLVANGVPVNQASPLGFTPLHFAVIPEFSFSDKGSVSAVRELIKAGANLNAKDIWKSTPLITAAAFGKTAACKELISAGAELNLVSDHGSALDLALNNLHLDTAKELVRAGATRKIATPMPKETVLPYANTLMRDGFYLAISSELSGGVGPRQAALQLLKRALTEFQSNYSIGTAYTENGRTVAEIVRDPGGAAAWHGLDSAGRTRKQIWDEIISRKREACASYIEKLAKQQ